MKKVAEKSKEALCWYSDDYNDLWIIGPSIVVIVFYMWIRHG